MGAVSPGSTSPPGSHRALRRDSAHVAALVGRTFRRISSLLALVSPGRGRLDYIGEPGPLVGREYPLRCFQRVADVPPPLGQLEAQSVVQRGGIGTLAGPPALRVERIGHLPGRGVERV